jgi:dTDP-4-dehydrorhamnose reductase
MPKEIIVIGGTGQVGKRLRSLAQARQIPVLATGHTRAADTSLVPLDVRDRAQVINRFGSRRPSHVFLPAALTNVDYCEDHPDEAKAINVAGTRYVAEACQKAGAKLIYLSTEYVFDGKAGPYREDDRPNPLSVYARTKYEGEKIVLGLPNGLVVRTTVVYDWDPDSKNFIMGLIQRLSSGQAMRVPKDQKSHPTLARNLADALWEMAEKDLRGVYHFVGPDYLDRYEFALRAADVFGFDRSLIQPVTTAELNQKASRPLQAGLYTDKAKQVLRTPFVDARTGLAMVKEAWDIGKR